MNHKKFIPGVGTYDKAPKGKDYVGNIAPAFARQKR
jgi:hypothetical protein